MCSQPVACTLFLIKRGGWWRTKEQPEILLSLPSGPAPELLSFGWGLGSGYLAGLSHRE